MKNKFKLLKDMNDDDKLFATPLIVCLIAGILLFIYLIIKQ